MSKIKKNHKPQKKKNPSYRLRNWSQYNQALVKRGNLTVWFSEDVLDQWYYQGPPLSRCMISSPSLCNKSRC